MRKTDLTSGSQRGHPSTLLALLAFSFSCSPSTSSLPPPSSLLPLSLTCPPFLPSLPASQPFWSSGSCTRRGAKVSVIHKEARR